MNKKAYCVLSCDDEGNEHTSPEMTLSQAVRRMKTVHPATLINFSLGQKI